MGKEFQGKGLFKGLLIQNYYGTTIRQNQKRLYSIKKAVGTVLYHCSNVSNQQMGHWFFPTGKESWCKWRENKEYGENSDTKMMINLPLAIKGVLMHILKNL